MSRLRKFTGTFLIAAAVASVAASPAAALVGPIGKAAYDESSFLVPQSAGADDLEGALVSALRSKYGSGRALDADCNSRGYCTWTVYKTGKRSLANVFHLGQASVSKSVVKKKVVYSVTLRALK